MSCTGFELAWNVLYRVRLSFECAVLGYGEPGICYIGNLTK